MTRSTQLLPLVLVLLLAACPTTDDDDTTVVDDDDTAIDDDDTLDDDDSAQPEVMLSGTVQDDSFGTLIIEVLPAVEGAEVQRFELNPDEPFALTGLSPGPVGIHAWIDEDGDGEHDGVWASSPEYAARLGVSLPRHDLVLALSPGPAGGFPFAGDDGNPLLQRAWELAAEHVAAGTTANGFADHYMDEAFSEQIFQWDTCFMALFGRYGLDSFPVMQSLDNFYGVQQEDGYICRVVNEADGAPGGDASDPSEPMINPPLFAWVELAYVKQTGDLSRLPRVLPILDAYHDWMDANVRTAPGLYYTSMLGSGMDNAPRDDAFDGWVDITAQMALARRNQAELHLLAGQPDEAAEAEAEAERICADVRDLMWDDDDGFFYDLGQDMAFLTDRTLASVWPLVARCATDGQAARVIDHLRDPAEFWRVHTFPSAAADSSSYDPAGHYWRGGVWAPTNYATIAALKAYGRHDLARLAAKNTIRNLQSVHDDFEADAGLLSPEAIGDGTGTLWELYAPDSMAPGTRWDQTYYGRQDFVGWTGLGPIALMLEQVVGLEADAPSDTLTWRPGDEPWWVGNYRFGDQLIESFIGGHVDFTDAITVEIVTSDAFTLVVEDAGQRHTLEVPAGETFHVFDAPEGPWPAQLAPTGPFPGHAVLGNGQVSAVWSDDDGTADPAGLRHLYLGDFGLDLVQAGRLRVGVGEQAQRPRRVGLDPFFAAWSEVTLPDGGQVIWRSFVGEQDAVVVDGVLVGGPTGSVVRLAPDLALRGTPHIDDEVQWTSNALDGAALVAELSDGRALATGTSPAAGSWQAGDFATDPLDQLLSGEVEPGGRIAMTVSRSADPEQVVPFRWVVATGASDGDAVALLDELLTAEDPLGDAEAHWADWSPSATCGDDSPDCRLAAAGIYAARASSLSGMVPADLTGQFVTNDFPQLYPRDALMVARVFQLTGHDDEAWEILSYWLDPAFDGPQPGEWYARYDALGRGVDAGSGADYDVPEWDAAGYMAVLAERLGPAGLTVDQEGALLTALDLVVGLQDENGLWTEGGIVEWVGRLPGTAMTLWAGLDAGARLADDWGEDARAADYRAAAGKVRGGLFELVDWDRPTLTDQRDGGLAYDTSMLFGPVWGYPPAPVLDRSLDWIDGGATTHGDGVRYFEGMGYGQDLFFFTTSAAAQYALRTGEDRRAERFVDWMKAFTNRYGLAPERVYSSGNGASEASPLSWCSAELGMTVLELRSEATGPVVDGVVDPDEYLRDPGTGALPGAGVVDHDGAEDTSGSPVALYAVWSISNLVVGLRTAGDPTDVPGAQYLLYLSSDDGAGSVSQTEMGAPLHFRADPGAVPAASARIAVDPTTGTCLVGEATDDGFDELPCAAVAFGDRGFEVEIEPASAGLTWPVQLIAVATLPDGEELLPERGSLEPEGDDSVLVTFGVDATSIAGQLDPDNGIVVTLSGDIPELGGWLGNAIGLTDDGTMGDETTGDGWWTTTVRLPRQGAFSYKYLVGTVGDGSWDGVEYTGGDRTRHAWDLDGDGRIALVDTFGVPGGAVIEP
jgi:hypothetical protein